MIQTIPIVHLFMRCLLLGAIIDAAAIVSLLFLVFHRSKP